MPYSVDDKVVVAVASSALFDLGEADRIYHEEGTEKYRAFQRAHENDAFRHGVAFALVKRLLTLNGPTATERLVEVILLSRNDPDTGLRVFKSFEHYGLDITRAAFTSGRDPIPYLPAFNAALFLSASLKDVKGAIMNGSPAARVFPTQYVDDPSQPELRIAFDFDGVIGDDSAETINTQQGLAAFLQSEKDQSGVTFPKGPLHKFFSAVSRLQQRELSRREADKAYEPRIRIYIVTARNAPAHERVVNSLRSWGIQVDEVFFLGGIAKSKVLEVFKPHIFFDDQIAHIEGAASVTPSAHVPFGIANQATELLKHATDSNEFSHGTD